MRGSCVARRRMLSNQRFDEGDVLMASGVQIQRAFVTSFPVGLKLAHLRHAVDQRDRWDR